MFPMAPAGRGVWRLACHRSLDAPPPGDWTIRVSSLEGAQALSIGCWLARDVVFKKQ
ncbi:MAG: hypothetical protein E5X01_04405 [Mesorhizobium sp.]|nr:MAG: hypothetical protein E5X01_04405 [Mesorhizobium sp.]